jgi:hypothetical protein
MEGENDWWRQVWKWQHTSNKEKKQSPKRLIKTNIKTTIFIKKGKSNEAKNIWQRQASKRQQQSLKRKPSEA